MVESGDARARVTNTCRDGKLSWGSSPSTLLFLFTERRSSDCLEGTGKLDRSDGRQRVLVMCVKSNDRPFTFSTQI